ncbi:MAG: hypothetical protein KDE51_28100, partial [Anaerolineales bacterium]|nr:hypothetical protein [Anaerolineales bacterium]
MDFATLKARLLKLDVSCLCDANKRLRVLDRGLRPLQQNVKFVGRAHTVTCHEDFLTVLKGLHDAAAD